MSPAVLPAVVQPGAQFVLLRDNGVVIANQDGLEIREEVAESSGATATRLVRLGTAAAIGLNVLLPAIELARTTLEAGAFGNPWVALLGTACALPLHLRNVAYGLRGDRPPGAYATLVVLAAVSIWASVAVGPGWLLNLSMLAVSVLIVVRGPLSLVLFGAVILSAWAIASTSTGLPPPYVALSVAWRAVTLFVPVRLVAAVRQLEIARRELSDRAVLRERLRIQAELRRAIGGALDDIVARAGAAAATVSVDAAAAREELRELVDGSRQALSDARRLISGYRGASVRAELDAAVTLLDAAGVESRVVVPDNFPLDTVDNQSQRAVRGAVIEALRDESLTRCVIEVDHGDGGQLRVWVSADTTAREARPAVGQ